MDSVANYVDTITRHWPLVAIVVCSLVVTYLLFIGIRAIVNRRYLLQRDTVWLEITPPASIAKTPEATEQLFSVIHGARAARQLKDRFYNRSPVMSFEIVSTRKDGILWVNAPLGFLLKL